MAERKDPYQYRPFSSPFAPPAVSEAERQQIVAQRPTATPTDTANTAIDIANWFATRQGRTDMPAPEAPFTRLAVAEKSAPAAIAAPADNVWMQGPNQSQAETNRLDTQAAIAAAPKDTAQQAKEADGMNRYLAMRAASFVGDRNPYLAALAQREATSAQSESSKALLAQREFDTLARSYLTELKTIDSKLYPPAGTIGPQKEEKAKLMQQRDVLMRGFMGMLGGGQGIAGSAEGGLVGYADGGSVDTPMAINPTADGKQASMETGDYVFPVEAVQFFGLKMLKDMVKKAMTSE